MVFNYSIQVLHYTIFYATKFSALMDEAASIRRPASETQAQALLNEARILLNFESTDENFNDKFQNALLNNLDGVLGHNDALNFVA